ncbi:hypothetical protein FRB90_002893 [Tulasnella sp. 427]|nr:hypothetical protein FRB90_002893 [Tulasnella sp. 427]
MSEYGSNKSFVLRGVEDTVFEERPVPEPLGAKRTIAIDIDQNRLDFAKSYAATDVWFPPKKNEGESIMEYSRRNADEMMAKLGLADRGPTSVDLIIEASGAAVCVQTGLFLVKTGGTFIQVGMGTPEVNVPITMLLVKELTVKGSFRYGPGDYELAIALVAQDKINLKPLVTHRFSFDDAKQAFETTKAGKSADGKGVIKAIIEGPQ